MILVRLTSDKKEADFLSKGASRSWFLLMLYNMNVPPSTQTIVELTAIVVLTTLRKCIQHFFKEKFEVKVFSTSHKIPLSD